MIYEIINPSDPYTIEGDDIAVVCVATAILGEGAYGLQTADGAEVMPILLFGRDETWFPERFGASFSELLQATPRDVLAACLESVKLGRDEPSSLNNIGAHAAALGRMLREA